jgi:hypothetical protein
MKHAIRPFIGMMCRCSGWYHSFPPTCLVGEPRHALTKFPPALVLPGPTCPWKGAYDWHIGTDVGRGGDYRQRVEITPLALEPLGVLNTSNRKPPISSVSPATDVRQSAHSAVFPAEIAVR